MEYTWLYRILALHCIFQRAYSDSHLCDVRQWYLKAANDGLFDHPLTPNQETVQYEVEDLLFQSRKDPDKKKIECILLQQFEDILRSKDEQNTQSKDVNENGSVDEAAGSNDDGTKNHDESEIDETDIFEEEDGGDVIDDPESQEDQVGQESGEIEILIPDDNHSIETPENTIENTVPNSDQDTNTNENQIKSEQDEIDTTKQTNEDNLNSARDAPEKNTMNKLGEQIGDDKPATDVKQDNAQGEKEIKDDEITRDNVLVQTDAKITNDNKIVQEQKASESSEGNTHNINQMEEAVHNLIKEPTDKQQRSEETKPQEINFAGVQIVESIEAENVKNDIKDDSIEIQQKMDEIESEEKFPNDNTIEANIIKADIKPDQQEEPYHEQMNDQVKLEDEKDKNFNIFWGTCRKDQSNPTDVFLSRYFPQVTNESIDPVPCTNCDKTNTYVDTSNTPYSTEKLPDEGVNLKPIEKNRKLTDEDGKLISPEQDGILTSRDIIDVPDEHPTQEQNMKTNKDENEPHEKIEQSNTQTAETNQYIPNIENIEIVENNMDEKQMQNNKQDFDETSRRGIDDVENAHRKDRDVKDQVRVDKIGAAEHEREQEDKERPSYRRHAHRDSIHEDMNLLKTKTLEYSDKIQSLEILIMRLENQLLLEKLDKQNHTGTITRLENSILKLENEILRLNQSHYDLVLENEIMQKQKKKYLTLDHIPTNTSKSATELSSKSNELITQQQNKISQLAELLKNQSKAIHQMKTKYEYLEDQNRMLFQMIMNQSSLMTQMMARVQELSDQNIQQRIEAQSLKEKLANSMLTMKERKERTEMSEMSMKLMEKLDSIVSDQKLDMVDETNKIKVDIPKSDLKTKGELEDEADITLKEYLRKTRQLADITQNWCGDHRMICLYKSIRLSTCVPFVPLYWSACEAIKKSKSARPRMQYGHDRRKDLSKQEEKEIQNKIEKSIFGGNKTDDGQIPKGEVEDSKSAFVQGSENKIVHISSNTDPEPTQQVRKDDNNQNNSDKTIQVDSLSDLKQPQNEDLENSKEEKESQRLENTPTIQEPKPEVQHVEDSKQLERKTDTIDKLNNSEQTENDKPNEQNNKPKEQNDKPIEQNDKPNEQNDKPNEQNTKLQNEGNTQNQNDEKTKTHNEEKTKGEDNTDQMMKKVEINTAEKKDGENGSQINQETVQNVADTKREEQNGGASKPSQQKEAKLNGSAQKKEDVKPKNVKSTQPTKTVEKETKPPATKTKPPQQQPSTKKEKVPEEIPRKIKYEKNGQTEPKDCYDYYLQGQRRNAVYKIKPYGLGKTIQVFCDMKQGGWTIIQKRSDGTTKFFREWVEYKNGFGGLYGEHWIGNDNIHYITNQDNYKLRIDLTDWEKTNRYAEYNFFSIEDEDEGYKLTINGYSGDAGDGMAKHNGHKFSTKDVDNDKVVKEFGGSCAKRFNGAWWYYKCYMSNLNGIYYRNGEIPPKLFDGITWKPWTGPNYSLRSVEMKIRPSSAK